MTNFAPFRLLLLNSIVLILFTNLTAHSQTIEANKFQTVPMIDGKLDDTSWQQITPIETFRIAE